MTWFMSLTLSDGDWTPIPRFLITRYVRRYSNAVLLLLLIWYQHLNWNNMSWPGIETLCLRTGWTASRVRNAIQTMSSTRALARADQVGEIAAPATQEVVGKYP